MTETKIPKFKSFEDIKRFRTGDNWSRLEKKRRETYTMPDFFDKAYALVFLAACRSYVRWEKTIPPEASGSPVYGPDDLVGFADRITKNTIIEVLNAIDDTSHDGPLGWPEMKEVLGVKYGAQLLRRYYDGGMQIKVFNICYELHKSLEVEAFENIL